jgi:hypothetical protein
MREIIEGIHHWTAEHPRLGMEVSSYYVEPARTLIDPLVSDEALRWIDGLEEPPETIVLTNRHHLRSAERLREELHCKILCHRAGLHEFENGPEVEGFAFGDELAPKVMALEVAVICEDECALHIDLGPGALAFADGVVHYGGELRFVPDNLIGENPEVIKEGLRRSYARMLDRPFDALLFAHGEPIAEGGKDALKEFAGQ